MSKPHYRRTASGRTMLLSDGLQNIVSGMGTERDKASHTTYAPTHLDITEIENAYQSSKFVQKIVDMPAEDAGREWREWQAGQDEISKIEATEKRLNVRGAVIDALKIARLRGGAAILIGTGDKALETPLDPERVQKNGLKYLAVVAKDQLEPGDLITDPRSEWYNQPALFELQTQAELIRIHPSRLVAFRGVVTPGKEVFGQDWWGQSILNAILTHVSRDEGAAANVDSLMFEAKVDVVKIKDFMANLRSGGSEFEKLVLDRLSLAMRAKGLNSTLILDAEEDYQQKSASFASLADLMDRFAARVAAVAEIPLTLMYGQSPGGLNATGEADTRGYYDRVKVRQTLDLEPNMTTLDECIIASALGNRPEEIHYNWRPLWQVSEKEIAENADKITSAAEKLERIGVPMEAVAKSTVNALTEIGAFPGLETEFSTTFEVESDSGADDVDPGTGEVKASLEGSQPS